MAEILEAVPAKASIISQLDVRVATFETRVEVRLN
jgi:hypothetical protein